MPVAPLHIRPPGLIVNVISRRDFLKRTGQACVAAGSSPLVSVLMKSDIPSPAKSIRCINVVNFIRGVEPRFQTDLLLPVQKQMELIRQHKLPATWLLQFDALVSGPFVQFLKEHRAENHEIGFWFEMNEKHCDAAGVRWRGRPGFEWDHLPPVAFTIGYEPEERIKLADTAMREFKSIWGFYPKSIASWNLDSITMSHLSEHYGVDAYAVCRDQIATDGFTIWGAPIAGYYPSKTNCWSPALDAKNQIHTPVFRMLGQDPVYYYEREYRLPDGRRVTEPDTMEPVWTSGRSPRFVEKFLNMISDAPTLRFAYAQIGQENSFPWPDMEPGYPRQMAALADLRDGGKVIVESMGDSGRRFKRAFKTTPAQSQVQLDDPFGNTNPAQASIWFQSRFYRANLHIRGDLPFIRDITVYSDDNPQPFLNKATKSNDVEQKMPPILDGYHWRKAGHGPSDPGAGMFFEVAGERAHLAGMPVVKEEADSLIAELPLQGGRTLTVRFDEKAIHFTLISADKASLALAFEWDPTKAPAIVLQSQRVIYDGGGFKYSVGIRGGQTRATETGWKVSAEDGKVSLMTAQAR